MPVKINVAAVPSYIELARVSKNNLLLIGPPGVGKSSIVLSLHDGDKYNVTMLTGSSTYEETVNGIPFREGQNQKYTVPEWFENMWEWYDANPAGTNLLFIDEFNTAEEQVLKTFLSVLTEHKVPTQTRPLPPNTVIVAAMNPQDQNNGSEFIRPLASRFIVAEINSSLDNYKSFLLGDKKVYSGAIVVEDIPTLLSKDETNAVIDQIAPQDWQSWEYGQLHEICPRSVSNYLCACRFLPRLEDRQKLGLAMLGFTVKWGEKVEPAKVKAKKCAFLSQKEIEELSSDEIREYMNNIKQSGATSVKALTVIGNCIHVLSNRGEGDTEDE